ncbi:MAG: hypothetical protein C4293_01530 [Nitrospiraceae bacterium]
MSNCVSLTPLRLTFDQDEEGFSIDGWPGELGEGSEQPTLILLADPFSTPMDEVLSLIADQCPGSIVIGGMAGGGHDLGQNRMLFNHEVYDGGGGGCGGCRSGEHTDSGLSGVSADRGTVRHHQGGKKYHP